MKSNRYLVALAVLLLSLFVLSIETEAKGLSNRNKRGVTNPSVNHDTLLRTNDTKDTNTRTSAKRKLKTLRNLSKACNCNCTMLQEQWGGFGSCFNSCLERWGVDTQRILTCTGFCVAASTGNPLGIIACVTCLGTSQWIVQGCSLKCAWGHAFDTDAGAEAKRRAQPRNNKRAPGALRV